MSINGWCEEALALHKAARWRGRDVRVGLPDGYCLEAALADAESRLESCFEENGLPPPHFSQRSDTSMRVELPRASTNTPLRDILLRRRTTRCFVESASMKLADLGTILSLVWGCHGTVHVAREFTTLRKTSPSGGGLHSIDVYPIIRSVEGIGPGLYHYDVQAHGLCLLTPYTRTDIHQLIVKWVVGQEYFAAANALFALTVRFDRLHWKYRNHERAYLVAAMEMGHLAQTFQLVCEEIGLGSFITAAINAAEIDDALHLDGSMSSVLAMTGCGYRAERETPLHPIMQSYPEDRSDGD
jgi:putative peptide maturation dehydrogenase